MLRQGFSCVARLLAANVVMALATVALQAGELRGARPESGKLCIENEQVALLFDEANSSWEVAWPQLPAVKIKRARFTLVADGRVLFPQNSTVEVASSDDALGKGREIRCRWGNDLEIAYCLRVYEALPAIAITARVKNNTTKNVLLDGVKMFEVSEKAGGLWQLDDALRLPAVVGYPYASPSSCYIPPENSASGVELGFRSAAVLAFSSGSPAGMVVGCLSARQGAPFVSARFKSGKGGIFLEAGHRLGKTLPAGKTMVLDGVWLAAEKNRFQALEHYGDAVAACASPPPRTGANALWCSWYPIRLDLSEEIALANAEIIAEHFKPLGMEVVQLDHGWQQGDICGDWVPNERFPHGLKWLAEELRQRYGLKLGLWIAPTQAAQTSKLFHNHPEWMKADAQGKPVVTGRWYWRPNPQMSILDAAKPEVKQWIEETFQRLAGEGVSYFKIDFIGGSPSLGEALAAIRRGAGPAAWLRFCNTPLLHSVGLADSAYIGDDTGDAGLPNWMELMRSNAPLLAASYWANDRLFHREICDMSIGPKADEEETRFRLSMMTLCGCSISFSDDLRTVPLQRIRMMQKCLPPGNPPSRPLDLFERERPSLWHVHCKKGTNAWDVVGFFNFEDQPQEITLPLAKLGMDADVEALAFDYWEEKFRGVFREQISLTLAPETARILLIHRKPRRPQVIATNMHLLGGYHEIEQLSWDEKRLVLTGKYRRAPGLSGRAFIYVPNPYRLHSALPSEKGIRSLTFSKDDLLVQEVDFEQATVDWAIPFHIEEKTRN